MSVEVGVWRIDDETMPIRLAGLDLESRLQEIIANDISIVSPQLMVIGREVATPAGTRIDILAVDHNGDVVVIELKRERTPRDVVAQVLDYGSWIRKITSEQLQTIFDEYQRARADPSVSGGINEALKAKFNNAPVELNAAHRLVIVASQLDPATERIVTYLREDYRLDINVALVRAFEDSGRQYLTTTWLQDDDLYSFEAIPSSSSKREWNGEFYANFEEGDRRHWSDAVEYGYVSAGGDPRFERYMRRLTIGSLVWVLAPGKGYVGVGRVASDAKYWKEFEVSVNGESTPISEVPFKATNAFGEEDGEWFVAIDWRKTVSIADAIREPGLFGNQNTVAQPLTGAWQLTVDLLRRKWGIE